MTIPIGIVLADAPAGGWERLGAAAAELEAAGAASVWLTDHLFWNRPTSDAIGGLHALAAATEHATIGPLVLQLPMRHVASTAKSLSYLDHLSGGRVVVGVGVGEHEAEFRAAGVAERFAHRGQLLDDGIDELRTLWSGVARDGFAMAPVRQLPIWVGGRSAAARRRAASRGDAWAPHMARAEWFAGQRSALLADLDAAGRSSSACTTAPVLAAAIDDGTVADGGRGWFGQLYGLPSRAFDHAVVAGSAAAIADEVGALGDAGADAVTLFVPSHAAVEHLAAVLDSLG